MKKLRPALLFPIGVVGYSLLWLAVYGAYGREGVNHLDQAFKLGTRRLK